MSPSNQKKKANTHGWFVAIALIKKKRKKRLLFNSPSDQKKPKHTVRGCHFEKKKKGYCSKYTFHKKCQNPWLVAIAQVSPKPPKQCQHTKPVSHKHGFLIHFRHNLLLQAVGTEGMLKMASQKACIKAVVYSHKKASQTFLYFVLTVLTQCRLPRNKMHSALHGNVMILPLTLLSTSNASVHRLSKDFKFPCSWLSCTYFRHPKHHFVTFWF